jgi:hypothetical protein
MQGLQQALRPSEGSAPRSGFSGTHCSRPEARWCSENGLTLVQAVGTQVLNMLSLEEGDTFGSHRTPLGW